MTKPDVELHTGIITQGNPNALVVNVKGQDIVAVAPAGPTSPNLQTVGRGVFVLVADGRAVVIGATGHTNLPAPPPPPPLLPPNGVISVPAIQAGTFRAGQWDNSQVRTGPSDTGAYFFGHSLNVLRAYSPLVTVLRLWLPARIDTTGDPAVLRLSLGSDPTQPPGSPDASGNAQAAEIAIPADWAGGHIDLPSTWHEGRGAVHGRSIILTSNTAATFPPLGGAHIQLHWTL